MRDHSVMISYVLVSKDMQPEAFSSLLYHMYNVLMI